MDAAINLVPFIDLMAVTISFLIMTAVWTQVGRLSVSQSGGGTGDGPVAEQVPLTLHLSEARLVLTVGGVETPLPHARDAQGRLDVAQLVVKLREVRAQLPTQSRITLQTDDGVRYEDLVRTLDSCIGAGLDDVAVSPSMG